MRLFYSLCLFLFCFSLQAQLRVAVTNIDGTYKSMGKVVTKPLQQHATMMKVPTYILDFFVGNKKFIVIDRINEQLITKERELQKSEDFIDGYMVEQGRSEGVDYMIKPVFDFEDQHLTIHMFKIADGTLISSIREDRGKDLETQVFFMLHKLLWGSLGEKFTLVRTVEFDGSVVMINFGQNQKATKGQKMEIFSLVEEKIDGQSYSRKEVIAMGKIGNVLDANFSEMNIKDKKEIVAASLTSGKKLYCLPLE